MITDVFDELSVFTTFGYAKNTRILDGFYVFSVILREIHANL